MLEVVGASESVVFVGALALMLGIGVLELVGLGAGHADLDIDAGGDLLGWLGVGRLPFLLLLVLFLAGFGILGLVGQQASRDLTGAPIDPWIAVPAVAALALPVTGLLARVLGPLLPRDHTTAVPLDALVGRRGRIVTGRAAAGSPARARVEDHHGQAHYVMVEPNLAGDELREGDTVLLVRREADLFRAVDPDDPRSFNR